MSVKQLIDIDELRENFQHGKITCYGMTIQEIINLKKENEELKSANEHQVLIIKQKDKIILELKSQIEKLKKELESWKKRATDTYLEQ